MSQNSTNKFLFIDVETNGLPLNYNKHYTDINYWPRIVQIAWIICDDIKSALKVGLILLLDEFGYPPVERDEVYVEIFEQAENFKKNKI